jgi:FkbM family methyltransferase
VTDARRVTALIDRANRKVRFKLLETLLGQELTIPVRDLSLKFRCRSEVEFWRARSLPYKEAGTVEWICDHVRPGEVFCDVGANVGLYSLLAAKMVGPTGRVYSFEPHLGNAESLLENVTINGLMDVVEIFSVALADQEGYGPFNYFSLVRGTSQSQYDSTQDDSGQVFSPVGRETKHSASLDGLIEAGVVRPPHHVKIDVDGNERSVLDGMRRLLAGEHRPRTIQVEMNPRNVSEIGGHLATWGYGQPHRHETLAGKEKIGRGVDPSLVAHNVVFHAGERT